MKNKWLHIAFAALLFSSDVTIQVYAESNSTIEDTLNQQEVEKQKLQTDIEELQKQIEQFDLAMENNQNELDKLQTEIQKTKELIIEKQAKIVQLQTKIAQRQEVLKNRLTTLQSEPRANLITDVLLETESFADLLDKLYSVNLILESDNTILEEQEDDQQLLEEEMKLVEEKQASLQKAEADLQAKQAQLEENQKQKRAVLETVQQQFQQTLASIMNIEEEKKLLEAQAALTGEEQPHTEDIEHAAPSSSNGFIIPAAGVYSSGFGHRSDGDHKGLDIAASGPVPIVAAASGKVIRSYYSSSYGNVVFISHNINGQSYTTVYAHMRNRAVSEGQSVAQGQQIGIMGNTGMSQGQHLHFEVHAGSWNSAKSNAVDPSSYLP